MRDDGVVPCCEDGADVDVDVDADVDAGTLMVSCGPRPTWTRRK